jgi:hypothetical protein
MDNNTTFLLHYSSIVPGTVPGVVVLRLLSRRVLSVKTFVGGE